MSTSVEQAIDYVQRGWKVIPVPPRKKAPIVKNWPKLSLTKEEIPSYFEANSNIGVLLGERSGGLIDIDIDATEAAAAWKAFGLESAAVFGRTSNPSSHHLFAVTKSIKTKRFDVPVVSASGKATLIELRGEGGQTIMPGSVHLSGEKVQWVSDGDPTKIDIDVLLPNVAHVAVVAALVRLAPGEGGRNDFYQIIAGLLARYLSEQIVEKIFRTVTSETGDEEATERLTWVKRTFERIEAGHPVSGLPKAEEYFGVPVFGRLADWLGLVNPNMSHRNRAPATDASITTGSNFAKFASSHPGQTKKFTGVLHPAALHGIAGAFVKTVSPHSESDPVGLLAQFLVVCGSIIGRGSNFRVESSPHYTNEMLVLVGESSRGRKGSSLNWVLEVARAVDPAWAKDCVSRGLSRVEGLIWAVRDPVYQHKVARSKQDKERAGEDGMVTDLVDVGIEDKRLLVIESELANVLSQLQREGNTLSPLMRTSWDGDDLNSMTKNSPVKSTAPHISLNAHITAHELKSQMSNVSYWNGLANRLLFFYVRRTKLLPRGGELTSSAIDSIAADVRAAVQFSRTVGSVGMTEEAWERWDKVYRTLAAAEPQGMLGAVLGRVEPHIRRLAVIYALLDHRSEVGVSHLTAAMALVDYYIRSCQFIFGENVISADQQKVVSVLDDNGGSLTQTEISTIVFQKHKSSQQLQELSQQMTEAGVVEVREQRDESRLTKIWVRIGEVGETLRKTGLEDFLPDSSEYEDQLSTQLLLGEIG